MIHHVEMDHDGLFLLRLDLPFFLCLFVKYILDFLVCLFKFFSLFL